MSSCHRGSRDGRTTVRTEVGARVGGAVARTRVVGREHVEGGRRVCLSAGGGRPAGFVKGVVGRRLAHGRVVTRCRYGGVCRCVAGVGEQSLPLFLFLFLFLLFLLFLLLLLLLLLLLSSSLPLRGVGRNARRGGNGFSVDSALMRQGRDTGGSADYFVGRGHSLQAGDEGVAVVRARSRLRARGRAGSHGRGVRRGGGGGGGRRRKRRRRRSRGSGSGSGKGREDRHRQRGSGQGGTTISRAVEVAKVQARVRLRVKARAHGGSGDNGEDGRLVYRGMPPPGRQERRRRRRPGRV